MALRMHVYFLGNLFLCAWLRCQRASRLSGPWRVSDCHCWLSMHRRCTPSSSVSVPQLSLSSLGFLYRDGVLKLLQEGSPPSDPGYRTWALLVLWHRCREKSEAKLSIGWKGSLVAQAPSKVGRVDQDKRWLHVYGGLFKKSYF